MHKIEIGDGNKLTRQEKEVYRTLRTNIEFTGVENRAIAITSVVPNDGKTTVTWNLAQMFAENGKKTLVVDADMRKSVLFQRLKIQEELPGLSHYLSGQKSLNDIICATNKPNMYLIPAGVFPANPTELLGNERFEQMLKTLKNTVDYILIDTPPLSNVIDAAVAAKAADGSILVVASDVSSRVETKSVTEQLRAANSNILGVVLNKVDVRRGSYYGKYGSYGKYGGYYGHSE